MFVRRSIYWPWSAHACASSNRARRAIESTAPARSRPERLPRAALLTAHGRCVPRWIKRFILFHGKRHPTEMGTAEINAFLTHLAVDGHVGVHAEPSVSCPALSVSESARSRPGRIVGVIRAVRPKRLPVVLTRVEVDSVLAELQILID